MKLHTLGGFDRQTLRPLSLSEMLQQDARRCAIQAEMQRAAEQPAHGPLAELRSTLREIAVACTVAAPVVLIWIVYLADAR